MAVTKTRVELWKHGPFFLVLGQPEKNFTIIIILNWKVFNSVPKSESL